MFDISPTEGLSGTEALEGMETRSLEEMTFEPASYLEGRGEFQQAETLQVSLEAVIASLAGEEAPSTFEKVSDIPLPLPSPAEEVSVIPVPVPSPSEEVSTLPEPLPSPAEEVSTLPVPLPSPAEEISTLPTPLPRPTEEVSSLPEPIPGERGGEVGDLPTPLLNPIDGASSLPGAAGEGSVFDDMVVDGRLNSLTDLGAELQFRLQDVHQPKDQAEKMVSNVLQSWDQMTRDLITNLKT